MIVQSFDFICMQSRGEDVSVAVEEPVEKRRRKGQKDTTGNALSSVCCGVETYVLECHISSTYFSSMYLQM